PNESPLMPIAPASSRPAKGDVVSAATPSIESSVNRTSGTRLASESIVDAGEVHVAKPSSAVFPGWGGAATTNPRLASAIVRYVASVGRPHAPCEKTISGNRPRWTRASRRPSGSAVPVPAAAGYQTTVVSGRGACVVTEVFVNASVVTPTRKCAASAAA